MRREQLRLFVIAIGAGFVGGLLSQILTPNAVAGPASQPAGNPEQRVGVFGEVRAHAFRLVGDHSQEVGALETASFGGRLVLRRQDGKGCAIVGPLEGECSMLMESPDGQRQVHLNVRDDGASVRLVESEKVKAVLSDTFAGSGLCLNAKHGKTSAFLKAADFGDVSLRLADHDGELRAAFGNTTTVNKNTGSTTNHTTASIHLFKPDGTVLWCAPPDGP